MTTQEITIMGLTLGVSVFFLLSWRIGVLGTIIFGFLMDPVRKLVPEEPVYLSALVVLPIVATFLGAWRSGARLSPRRIFGMHSPLVLPLVLFFVLVLIQTMNSLFRTGSLAIAMIGFLAYFAPMTGLVLGYNFPTGTSEMSRLFRIYIVCTIVMAAGIYMVKLGYGGVLLDPVGEGLFVYSSEKIRLESGLFRSSEIAAWHMATAICLLFILAFTRKKSLMLPYLLASLIPFLLGALLFTGRRKALVVIVLFLAVYVIFVTLFKRGAGRAVSVFAVLFLIVLGLVSFTDLGKMGTIEDYYTRSGGIRTGMEIQRVRANWITSIGFVVARNGVFGSGAGVGSQGAQYFGAGGSMVGASAEGGIGKIVAELGIPGLVLLLWLVVAGARQFWSTAAWATRAGGRRSRYVYGLVGVLFGNIFIFTIGHQIFGDPYVLFVLGVLIGFALVTPFIAEGRVLQRDREKTVPYMNMSNQGEIIPPRGRRL